MRRLTQFFVPQDRKFFEMLEEQSQNVCNAAVEFNEMINGFNSMSEEELKSRVDRIKKFEHRGDDIVRDITTKLHKSFITPIDREDIHELTNLLDDLLDFLDGFSRKLRRYGIKEIPEKMMKQIEIVDEVIREVDKGVKGLRKARDIDAFCNKVHRLEDDADEVHNQAVAELFSNSRDSVEIIKLKDLYEDLETLTDRGKHIATIIENIVVKHA